MGLKQTLISDDLVARPCPLLPPITLLDVTCHHVVLRSRRLGWVSDLIL